MHVMLYLVVGMINGALWGIYGISKEWHPLKGMAISTVSILIIMALMTVMGL